ncbi:hypothetical protein PoB_004809300 [Plakobranchus ocellatus]|uniref:Uncharacterized protein n=1 Tax=Plakobranchus ocellatus TaxID=259542 RepID=A0AAV4BR31_9GAST|nr:hypothetical protein PoB_004809300 [Plakobranchus ocellatus]
MGHGGWGRGRGEGAEMEAVALHDLVWILFIASSLKGDLRLSAPPPPPSPSPPPPPGRPRRGWRGSNPRQKGFPADFACCPLLHEGPSRPGQRKVGGGGISLVADTSMWLMMILMIVMMVWGVGGSSEI